MPKSMTGFGTGKVDSAGCSLQVDIKSVNNRYCDINVRMPRLLLPLEPALRRKISAAIDRGKIEVYVQFIDNRETAVEVVPNLNLAAAYVNAVNLMSNALSMPCEFGIRDLLRVDGVFKIQENELDLDMVGGLLDEATDAALENLIRVKQIEGERLTSELLNYVDQLETKRRYIASRMPAVLEAYYCRLKEKLQELISDRSIDETRITMEAAIYADKIDVSEEMTRLASYFDLLRHTLNSDKAVGKKLDFIVQEINREINTTGSKANDAEVTGVVVDMKCINEKLREQIQNIE